MAKITLKHFTLEEFKEKLKNLPPDDHVLDLSGNRLYKMGGGLANTLASVPPHITSIDLSCNGFSRLTIEEHAAALKSIPSSVIKLNLSWNDFSLLSIGSLQALRDTLPSVKHVLINKSAIKSMSSEKRLAFKDIFPNLTLITLTNDKYGVDEIIGHLDPTTLGQKPSSLTFLASFWVNKCYKAEELKSVLPAELLESVSQFDTEGTESPSLIGWLPLIKL